MVSILVALGVVLYIYMAHSPEASGKEDVIPEFIRIFAYVTGILSIVFMYNNMCQTRHVAEAQFIHNSTTNFYSHKMLASLRELAEFGRRKPSFFRLHRTEFYNPSAPMPIPFEKRMRWSHAMDEARRYVKGYFFNALELYMQGKISKKTLRAIVDKSALTILFDIVEPMESQMNPVYDYLYYHTMMLVAGDIYTKRSLSTSCLRYNKNRIRSATNKMGDAVREYAPLVCSALKGLVMVMGVAMLYKRGRQ